MLKYTGIFLAIISLLYPLLSIGCASAGSELTADLLQDTTNESNYLEYLHGDEHFARDLEDNLEELGYAVTYLTAFEFTDQLLWLPLLKVQLSEDFVVVINPRTDLIVNTIYDGDGDGQLETLTNKRVDDVSHMLEQLVETKQGNDGQYLIFEFDDYESVRLIDTTVSHSDNEDGGTIAELMIDLDLDGISERNYIEDLYDCDDFSRDLEDVLEEKGYRATINLIWWLDSDEKVGHSVVEVHGIDNDITIEPQTDEDVSVLYDGNGNGEIDSAYPGAIEAQVWLFAFYHELPFSDGTDGDYLIFGYSDFDDIPFPVD